MPPKRPRSPAGNSFLCAWIHWSALVSQRRASAACLKAVMRQGEHQPVIDLTRPDWVASHGFVRLADCLFVMSRTVFRQRKRMAIPRTIWLYLRSIAERQDSSLFPGFLRGSSGGLIAQLGSDLTSTVTNPGIRPSAAAA